MTDTDQGPPYLEEDLPSLEDSYLRRPNNGIGGEGGGDVTDWDALNHRAVGALKATSRVVAIVLLAIWPR